MYRTQRTVRQGHEDNAVTLTIATPGRGNLQSHGYLAGYLTDEAIKGDTTQLVTKHCQFTLHAPRLAGLLGDLFDLMAMREGRTSWTAAIPYLFRLQWAPFRQTWQVALFYPEAIKEQPITWEMDTRQLTRLLAGAVNMMADGSHDEVLLLSLWCQVFLWARRHYAELPKEFALLQHMLEGITPPQYVNYSS